MTTQERHDSIRVNGLIKSMLDSAKAFSAVAEIMAISERNKIWITISQIVMTLYVIYESNSSPYFQLIALCFCIVFALISLNYKNKSQKEEFKRALFAMEEELRNCIGYGDHGRMLPEERIYLWIKVMEVREICILYGELYK
jgi:hypothetical protein